MVDLVSGVEKYLSSGLLPVYYIIVACINFALIIKFKWNSFAVFIIFIFSEGLFAYLGHQYPIFNFTYKIGFFAIALALFHRPLILLKKSKKEQWLLFVVVFIGTHLLLTGYLNNSDFITTLSQFTKKYLILILFYFGIKNLDSNKLSFLGTIFIWVLGVQVFFAVLKLILFGFGESLIGSISFDGGGPSNILPVMGFLIIFIYRKGDLSKKDWLLIFGLFLIALIGNKRSVMIILPLIIGATLIYVQRSLRFIQLLKFSPFIIVLLYLGVKINPTLNPEGSRWGSFDPEYLQNYSMGYTFGNQRLYKNDDLIGGRGGTFLALLKNDIKLEKDSFFFGEGLNSILLDYEGFENERYGIAGKGSAGAVVQNFIAFGIIGTLLIFMLSYAFISLVKNRNLRIILFLFLLWDYILFYNSSIVINALGISLVYLIVLSNQNLFLKRYSPHSVLSSH